MWLLTKRGSRRGSEQASVKVVPGPKDVAQVGAEKFVALAGQAIQAHGEFRVALSGGSTPLAMYDRLVHSPLVHQVDWKRVFIYWGDERFVSQDDPENLFSAARRSLLSLIPIPQENVYPWPTGSASPEEAALQYADLLEHTFKSSLPRFNLVLLGMGPDGHTASLFPRLVDRIDPHHGLTVSVYEAPKPPPTRLSFTFRLINNAENVVFLVCGKDKASALQAVLQGESDPSGLPSQAVKPVNGHLDWLVDEQAASELHQPIITTRNRMFRRGNR